MPWDNLSMWRGVGPIYVDLMDNPELLHAFMRRFLDIRLDLMDRLEAMNLLDATWAYCTAAGPGGRAAGEIKGGRVKRRNLWGRGTAQVFASVSPAMHDEFEIEYAKKFFEGFGLVYYGCCEAAPQQDRHREEAAQPAQDLHHAMGGRAQSRRAYRQGLRAVEKAQSGFGRRPVARRECAAQGHYRDAVAVRENGTPVDITLKDISTVCYNPNNLTRWEQVVMETVRNF